ncbi:snake venom 5'-nucleotidase-like isoform X2 [Epinephelus fuscoguttatus]|uniref:snake venom 5'-nucleotidase-like isoform X2 n=1 Tax=Epinephelus fuscoguttatus TaxID=293821 RepID=UPI0020D19B80|nr:snake venom 5'-nucleotidase-like isoform X2 [Epinephelus fuscoguttatus]
MRTVCLEQNALSWLCLLLLLGFLVSTSAAWDLVVLHTNDVHARVEETSEHSGKCSSTSGCFAGVARRATMIKRIRSNESNVLLLDAGDQFQGTIWFNHYKGAEAAYFMNELGYDCMAFGNHEFDNEVPGLMKPFLEQINFTVLSANIKTDKTLALTLGSSYVPHKILTVGSERVGVIGYTTKETPQVSQPGPHLQFEDEVTAVQQQVVELQQQGVNKIIALGHAGIDVDKEIAKKVSGVDLVIGGHSDTFLYTGSPPSTEVPAGPYPLMVQSDDGRQVPVVQAYAFGKYLGYLKVTFDNAGNVVNATGNPILLDSSIPQDPDVLADVEEWKKGLANYSTQVVGNTLVFLNGTRVECRFGECNLGNLICDAMVDNNIRFSDSIQWNHVSASIFNGGGVRASIDERARNGSITMEDLISVLPFGNTFDLLELNGSTLFKIFEHSVRRYGQNSGEFLQVSGIQLEFDPSKPEGNRVTSLSILCVQCRVPCYEHVQPETVYKMVMPSFIAQGGDGFSMIPDEKLDHTTGNLDIAVVSEYIMKNQKVYTPLQGRIKVLNSTSIQPTPLKSTYGQTTPLSNSALGQTTPLVILVSLGLLWSLCGSMEG